MNKVNFRLVRVSFRFSDTVHSYVTIDNCSIPVRFQFHPYDKSDTFVYLLVTLYFPMQLQYKCICIPNPNILPSRDIASVITQYKWVKLISSFRQPTSCSSSHWQTTYLSNGKFECDIKVQYSLPLCC